MNSKLVEHVLKLSQSDDMRSAILEWELDYIYPSKELRKCPCGVPIKDICYIKNKHNNHRTFVGNECIKIFTNMTKTEIIFDGLKRIKEDLNNAANLALINYAKNRGYIDENEISFAINTCRKRVLSDKQSAYRRRINYKIVTKFSKESV